MAVGGIGWGDLMSSFDEVQRQLTLSQVFVEESYGQGQIPILPFHLQNIQSSVQYIS